VLAAVLYALERHLRWGELYALERHLRWGELLDGVI
jgi:hypothetical protein